MTCFVDTSALMAVLDHDDSNHVAADTALRRLRTERAVLLTTNYVVVELIAVAQRRLGIEAVRALQTVYLPGISLLWVDVSMHESAIAALLAAGRRNLSLVDCTSFEVMRCRGITDAFVIDPHFSEQGFNCYAS
jgi:predicted nucleic acid-binding protein